jgi:quercetin dioxygenase-like cupin family protein
MVSRIFVALFVLGAIVAGGAAVAIAQDTTPAPDSPITAAELAPGVTAEVFGSTPSARADGQTLYVARFTFQPGSEIFPHGHPGTTLLGVSSGQLGWTLVTGSASVIRGSGAGATGPVEILSEPGQDVVLNPGDTIYYEDDVVHTARGAGDEPAVVMATLLLTAGEPLLMTPEQMAGMDMGATATP